MKITLDEHLQLVLEHMQQNIPTSKLVGVAEKLPDMARLLWSRYSQEPFHAIELGNELREESHEPQSVAI
jgi:hypothetical protein